MDQYNCSKLPLTSEDVIFQTNAFFRMSLLEVF